MPSKLRRGPFGGTIKLTKRRMKRHWEEVETPGLEQVSRKKGRSANPKRKLRELATKSS